MYISLKSYIERIKRKKVGYRYPDLPLSVITNYGGPRVRDGAARLKSNLIIVYVAQFVNRIDNIF